MGTIPTQTIEQIAAANDIVEVIGTYFPLKRAGSTFKALCPFHQEKTPSFTVSPSRQTFHCFGCGAGGSVFRFVMDWQIGFAPESWDAFLSWALERGYQQRLLLESGLVTRRDESAGEDKGYDRFRNRIMFPIHNDVGEVIAFSGRILDKEAEAAKYVNSPETPLFRKGRVLFGLHKTKRGLIEADCAIVCEGQLDLITLFEAGITNVVAPQGTAFTENQARILKRFVSEVVLCFDADAAGQKAAERSLDALLQNNLVVRVAEMPPGEDPDSLVRKGGREAFEKQVAAARDFFDW